MYFSKASAKVRLFFESQNIWKFFFEKLPNVIKPIENFVTGFEDTKKFCFYKAESQKINL